MTVTKGKQYTLFENENKLPQTKGVLSFVPTHRFSLNFAY